MLGGDVFDDLDLLKGKFILLKRLGSRRIELPMPGTRQKFAQTAVLHPSNECSADRYQRRDVDNRVRCVKRRFL